MSTVTSTPIVTHPNLTSLRTLLTHSLNAGYHLRHDIGLPILDQRYFIELLKQRAKILTRDSAALNSSENADHQRAIRVRIMPALRAVEKEAKVLLRELRDLVMIAGALEKAENEGDRSIVDDLWEESSHGAKDEDEPLISGDGMVQVQVTRPPLVISGSEDLDVAILDAMRAYRINNGPSNQEGNGENNSDLCLFGEGALISPRMELAEGVTRPILVFQQAEDSKNTINDAMEQYRTDSAAARTESAGVTPIYDAIADELDVIITKAIQQYSLDNEASVEENTAEDKDYDADTQSISGTTATEQTTGEEPEAHPYPRSNLTPVRPSIRIPTLPRFDSSAVLGEPGYVRRQTQWIDARVAAEKA